MERSLKEDILFKSFFSRKGNEKYLISFLEALLKIKVKTLKVNAEVSLEKLFKEEKGGSLDLQVEVNGELIVNIEMQRRNEHNIKERTTVYGSKIMSREVGKGVDYKKIKKVIMVNILDYILFREKEEVSRTAIVLDEHREYEVIKDIQWYFIELPKFRNREDINIEDPLNQWLLFIDNSDRRLIEMVVKNNKIFRDAKEDIEYLTGEEEERRLQDLRERWEMDRISEINYAKEEGERKGRQLGEQLGEKRGRQLGEKRGENNIIKKLFKNKMPAEEIAEKLGMALSDVLKIVS